jgi:hypothetical protein
MHAVPGHLAGPGYQSSSPICVSPARPATCGPLPRIEELIDLLEHRSHE